MRSRFALTTATILACVLGLPVIPSGAATPAATKTAVAPAPAKAAPAARGVPFEKAIFAGGCFWCEETAFEGLPGVQSVISGYTGGFKKNPTYEEVSSGTTGHAESVEVTFDPRQITYAQLLDLFWHNVDPTQANGQFCDHGTQYRSAIFYRDSTQKRLAEESKRRIEATPHHFTEPIVTQIVAASVFYPAEEYHQDFYKKDPVQYQSYRMGCGRDRRLTELWGKPGRQGHAR
jgi:peptide-methionine (S)-S-oxide reductase